MQDWDTIEMPWCEPCGSYHSKFAASCRADPTLTHAPAPTYEQAVVHMFRTAKGILEVGQKLHDEWLLAKQHYSAQSSQLMQYRLVRYQLFTPGNQRRRGHRLEREVCQALDRLWLAQEKYKAWTKTYGEL
jgi:hypothetical protein